MFAGKDNSFWKAVCSKYVWLQSWRRLHFSCPMLLSMHQIQRVPLQETLHLQRDIWFILKKSQSRMNYAMSIMLQRQKVVSLAKSSLQMPNYLPISADPGPVRNLQCHYIISRKKPFVCKWSEPERPNGRMQYYIVNLNRLNRLNIRNWSKRVGNPDFTLLIKVTCIQCQSAQWRILKVQLSQPESTSLRHVNCHLFLY